SPGRCVHRPDSQGREARRPTGHAVDQVRVRDQPQHRQSIRPQFSARAARHCRRSDRMKRREFITLFGGTMEGTMMRFMLLLFVALLCGTGRLAAQQTVEMRGITSVVKMEEVTFGHLPELNGKFKLRATEMTFAPGGYIGPHHHAGPGIRYIISGELTF